MSTLTTTISVATDLATRYDEIAKATGQSLDQLVEAILRDYLTQEDEDRARIRASIAEADRGEFASHEEVEALFARYGGPDRAEQRTLLERELRHTARKS